MPTRRVSEAVIFHNIRLALSSLLTETRGQGGRCTSHDVYKLPRWCHWAVVILRKAKEPPVVVRTDTDRFDKAAIVTSYGIIGEVRLRSGERVPHR
jgi:hypothetical protein